jgi:hypothetical protein
METQIQIVEEVTKAARPGAVIGELADIGIKIARDAGYEQFLYFRGHGTILPGDDAQAVVLDFVQPVAPAGWAFGPNWQAGRNKAGNSKVLAVGPAVEGRTDCGRHCKPTVDFSAINLEFAHWVVAR